VARALRLAALESGMSQRTVQLLIGKIVTDEDLRRRFVEQPAATLRTMCELGFELTELEVDALVRTDRSLWDATANRLHPNLQRCSLTRASDQ
jgi:hypothetical protein